MRYQLFLDDCLKRCAEFRSRNPSATIVHTAADCIAQLGPDKYWDLVHLDHDLSGETYVNPEQVDCGMEVVRFVCLNKPDVLTFVVHTWNEQVAPAMVEALESAGYRVVRAPFRIRRFTREPQS